MSKRANIFYLERCRVMQRNDCVVYLSDSGECIQSYFNIPDKNTLFLMLGTGTSITNSAMRKLSESNVVVGFAGGGGSPLIAATDMTFILPQDEYRPTEYMQSWMGMWVDEKKRIELAKKLLMTRCAWALNSWNKSGLCIEGAVIERVESRVRSSETTTQLLSAEADWAKSAYRLLANQYGIDFKREEGKGSRDNGAGIVNSLIDHGNYLAYGYSAVVLHTMGIPFSMPILHGKTRRGGLVFDIADLVKDELVLPTAFDFGTRKRTRKMDQEFRSHVIEAARKTKVVDRLFEFIKLACEDVDDLVKEEIS